MEASSRPSGPTPVLFAAAVFAGAGLVFLVQPMMARILLPSLGGSAAVWNASVAFYQAALLAGYAYAHVLQRVPSLKRQMAIHVAVLAAAALVLPLRVTEVFGAPWTGQPVAWLVLALTLSLGAPFAALSATAPLVQAWYARTHAAAGRNPYVLYAASNLGSLLALIAYPAVVEPLAGLQSQTLGWSIGYGAFAVLILVLAARCWRTAAPAIAREAGEAPSWRRRGAWLFLSAVPCSLLLGVTQHITSDIASAPFLWVIPLALYLVSFIIAFQARPAISETTALRLQSVSTPVALLMAAAVAKPWLLLLPIHLAAFFITALVCAHRLHALRPPPSRLTEFYLWMSLGGVLGGAFNAFVAPIIFPGVWEYPIVLVLSALARPALGGRLSSFRWALLVAGAVSSLVVLVFHDLPKESRWAFLLLPAIAGVLVRDRPWGFAAAMLCAAAASYLPVVTGGQVQSHRSYFGVVQIADTTTRAIGPVRVMVHGSTLHGSQSLDPAHHCLPTTYYAPQTPIGQAMQIEQKRRPAIRYGVVGLGTGATATFVRPTDTLRFFEIDPMITALSMADGPFTYVRDCARGPVALTMGDARLSLEKTPDATFDVLLVDAFSSDAVPTHLMTVEAIRTYLRVIGPDGVVILHLSNRNLELSGPVAAAIRAAGGLMLEQETYSGQTNPYVVSSSQVMLAARSRQAFKPYLATPLWQPPTVPGRAWTDDHVNLPAALIARWKDQHQY
jgi:hypothetical protein